MVKARKGRKDMWDVSLPGLKQSVVVKLYPDYWCVTPLSLTEAQRQRAGALVKQHVAAKVETK